MANIRKRLKPRSLVVVSDTHSGCRLGMIHPDGIRLDQGGRYLPSDFQLGMWEWWREYWDEWVPEATDEEPYDVLHNGDALDGVHHNSTTQISHNLEDQQRIAEALLKPVADRCRKSGGTYYHIRGTEAHVGKSGEFEERLARMLGAKPNDHGQFARFEIWKRVGTTTKRVLAPLVHALHHIGTTSSAAHESSAVNAELSAMYVQAGRWKEEPPDIVVRSHRHRYIAVEVPSYKGKAVSVVTPAWQGKTPFVFKVPGARITEPQVGGVVVRQGDEVFYHRSWVRSFERSKEE